MLNNEDISNALSQMSIPEIVSITKELETVWNVSAKPQVSCYVVINETKAKVEQTEFDVVLLSVPADKKIPVIKALRELLGQGLIQCKALIEELPKTIKEGTSDTEADRIKSMLTELGAKIEVR